MKDIAAGHPGTRTDPLIAFVHVPKTAGSTVNRAVAAHFANGHAHCEAFVDTPAKLAAAARDADWLSGHVDFTRFSNRLGAVTDRPIRWFATLRDPVAQVMSHYNWVIEIYHRGPRFYESHPAHIREVSARIRASDNSDPEQIVRNLREFSGLFLNMQARTVLGGGFNWNQGRIPRRLGQYDFVATERDVAQMLATMTGAAPDLTRRENASTYHFDKAVFSRPRLRNFLLRENFLDWTLYQAVGNQAMRVAASRDFRRRRAAAAP